MHVVFYCRWYLIRRGSSRTFNRINLEGTHISVDAKNPRIVFVTGGSRSGKSAFAKRLAESAGDRVVYLATAQPLDDEMRERIKRHRAERPDRWRTVEEPLDLAGALLRVGGEADAVVVDCIGLWISNLLTGGSDASRAVPLSEDDAAGLAAESVSAAKSTGACVIFVSNEVGLGIVPEDAISRAFRDALGRVNQVLAEASDEAYFLVSGKAIPLKKPASQSALMPKPEPPLELMLTPEVQTAPETTHPHSSHSRSAHQPVSRRESQDSTARWNPLGPVYAFTFLTRIPLPGRLAGTLRMRPEQFRSAVIWFGAVGFLLGVILTGSDYLMAGLPGVGAPVATAVQLILLFLLTGGLHVDGLADTADGFLSGRERSGVLAVMRDSRIGSMGASAIVLVFLLNYVLLAGTPPEIRTAALLTAPAVSRLAMVIAMYRSVHARTEGGLATPFLEVSDLASVMVAIFITVALCSVAVGLGPSTVLCTVAAVFARTATWYSTKRIGGITGDVLGAVNEITFPVSLLLVRILNSS